MFEAKRHHIGGMRAQLSNATAPIGWADCAAGSLSCQSVRGPNAVQHIEIAICFNAEGSPLRADSREILDRDWIGQNPTGERKSMSNSIAALFQRLTQGVYVVGVAHGKTRNAFTAACVMQVSFDPLLLALSINPQHSSYGLLKQSGAFSVNVLRKCQTELAAHFGRPAHADKLAATKWTPGRADTPLLRDALAWFECEVVGEHPAGDHILVLGKVIDGRLLDSEAEPMAYRQTAAMDGASTLFPEGFGDA